MASVAASRLVGRRSPASWCKELLLGPPLATSRLINERLRKVVALAVFSSDAISSTAYGTEQIMLVLVAAGAAATGPAFPIALGIGGLLAVLNPLREGPAPPLPLQAYEAGLPGLTIAGAAA